MPVPAELCPLKIGDWLLINLRFYLTDVFPALINPCHLHTFYDRVTSYNLKVHSDMFRHIKLLGFLHEMS